MSKRLPARERRYCKHGHDTWIVGRYSGGCKGCRKESQFRRQREHAAYIKQVKLSRGCDRCGYKSCPTALQWHHLDPSTKRGELSKMTNVSRARIDKETAACELLCANCHFEEHYVQA